MGMNPCIECCYLRYGRKYDKENKACQECDYAKVTKECDELRQKVKETKKEIDNLTKEYNHLAAAWNKWRAMRLIDADEWEFRLNNMMPDMVDEKDKQSVRFALNIFRGAATVDVAKVEPPIDVETVAEAVHNARWEEKKKQDVTDHPDMLPYAELAENVKEYDRVTARAVLKALKLPWTQWAQRVEPQNHVLCEKCGKEIDHLLINMFHLDDDDTFEKTTFTKHPEGAVSIITTQNWTGYELPEEDRLNSIVCPYCKQYPFRLSEIDVYDQAEIVMFFEAATADRAAMSWEEADHD